MASLSQAGNAVCNVIGGAAMAILGTAGAVAAGSGTVAAGIGAGAASGGVIPLAIGGISLAALWCNRGRQHSVDSTKDLSKIAEKVQKRFTHTEGHGYTRTLDMDAASSLLERALADIALSPKALAETAMKVKDGAFPTAATAQIMDALEAWCRGGKAQADDMATFQNAKDFLIAVFNDGFTEAITNKAYFEKFEPQLLIEIAQETAKTRGLVEEVLDQLITEQEAREGNYQHIKLQIIATQDEMRAGFAELKTHITSELGELEERLVQRLHGGLTEPQVINILKEFQKEGIAQQDWEVELIKSAQRLKALRHELRQSQNWGKAWQNAKSEILVLVDAGDFRVAEQRLSKIRQQRIETNYAALREQAEIAATEGQLAAIEGRYLDAAKGYDLAAGYVREADPNYWASLKHSEAYHYDDHGELFPGDSLLKALRAYEDALTVYSRDTMPTEWAMTQQNKAIALEAMGTRAGGEEGLTYLRQAIDAYDNALTVYTPETTPTKWATTQQNKAGALEVMGGRAGGEEGLTYLRQAIEAYDKALTVLIRETMPAQWAMTQQNKAIALRVMGGRAGGEDGLTYLRQAIEAYDKALTVRTFETMPAKWAMTQQNKAGALRVMGERTGGEDGLTYLRQAIDAYDNALTVRTRETMPAQWATTQQNKATALQAMGERAGGEDGLTYLRQAIDAHDNALTVYTRETAPAYWAIIRKNMAILFMTRFGMTADILDSDYAQTAAEDAMSICSQGGMEYEEQQCQALLNKIAALKTQHQA